MLPRHLLTVRSLGLVLPQTSVFCVFRESTNENSTKERKHTNILTSVFVFKKMFCSEKDMPEGGRKWLFTINNPQENGYTLEGIIKSLETWKGVDYWCIGSETGVNENTPHYHYFIYCPNVKTFKTIKNRFPKAHIDYCNGTIMECRNYCFKEGHWKDSEKGTLHDYNSNKESGEPPEEKGRGHRTDLHELYNLIKEGKTDYEIMEICPEYMQQFEKIDKVRQAVRSDMYADMWRDLDVTYIWGATGAGKTRHVMDTYGYRNVYRVTDYYHPFDSYKGQDVVVFEEFRSSLMIGDMLKYLDGYPVELPARYNNKVACFTKVFIVTNIDIRNQYPFIQKEEYETFKAFLRRVKQVWFMTEEKTEKFSTEEYMKGEWRFTTENPFEEEK